MNQDKREALADIYEKHKPLLEHVYIGFTPPKSPLKLFVLHRELFEEAGILPDVLVDYSYCMLGLICYDIFNKKIAKIRLLPEFEYEYHAKLATREYTQLHVVEELSMDYYRIYRDTYKGRGFPAPDISWSVEYVDKLPQNEYLYDIADSEISDYEPMERTDEAIEAAWDSIVDVGNHS